MSSESLTISIVYNLANQASLIGACLLKATSAPFVTDVLVDIRDHITTKADRYILMDVGTRDNLKEYLEGQTKTCTREYVKILKDWIDSLDCRVYQTGHDELGGVSNHPAWESIHAARAADYINQGMYEAICIILDLSVRFNTNTLTAAETCGMYSILASCRRFSTGRMQTTDFLLKVETLATWIKRYRDCKPDVLENFRLEQKDINVSMTNKFREIVVGNEMLTMLTTTELEVYNLIRRAEMAGRNYVHISQGLYGSVVMTNHPYGYSVVSEQAMYKLFVGKPSDAELKVPEL